MQINDMEKIDNVVERMLASGEEVLNRSVLLGFMKEFGLAHNAWGGLAAFQEWYNVSPVGCLQIPTEIVDFLLYAARNKPKDLIEVGVYTGGTAIFACAFFQALDPKFQYHAVDIKDNLYVLPKTLKRLNISFHIPKSSDDFKGKAFDIVFIDGDHSYEWAKRDYLNLGQYARQICGFHDINGKEYLPKGGGVFRYWRRLRSSIALKATMLEICHAPAPGDGDGLWMGIGIIDFTSISR